MKNARPCSIARKVEKLISRFLTAGNRKNAFCDSHINLCLACIKTRMFLEGKPQNYKSLHIHTKQGVYIFTKDSTEFLTWKKGGR